MTLPVLDTKTYTDILEESVARIPDLTGQWTDFNPQDTGILLLEMMAGLTEQLNFMLDQVGDDFLVAYLRLLYGKFVDAENIQTFRAQFAGDCATVARAVTFKDFETLALESRFQLDTVHASYDAHGVTLTIFRKASALSKDEESAFYEYMRRRCLLGTHLTVRQAQRQKIQIDLRVQLDPRTSKGDVVKRELGRLLRNATVEKPMDEPLEMHSLLMQILSMPEVTGIKSLTIYDKEENGAKPAVLYSYKPRAREEQTFEESDFEDHLAANRAKRFQVAAEESGQEFNVKQVANAGIEPDQKFDEKPVTNSVIVPDQELSVQSVRNAVIEPAEVNVLFD